jgi:hypothetical protein
LLEARTVEPEKQPLLANGSETTFVSRQRLGKHIPAATDTHGTIEVFLETVTSTRSVHKGYKEGNWGNRISSVRESVRKRGSWKGAAVQRGLERMKVKNLRLEAVARERLVKTQLAGKVLAGAVVISDGAIIKCNYL